jgi:integrase
VAVHDRWHRDQQPGDEPCKCGTRRTPLYPGAAHQQGDRWQVRWRNLDGKQRKRNFALRIGSSPDLHADAFDAKTRRELDRRDYVDPEAADVTLRAYAEQWRLSRSHDTITAGHLERRLRLHVYEDPSKPGRTPRGGVAIGQLRLAALARQPSLVQAWITSLPLLASSARLVIGDVGAVLRAAMDDGIVGRDPTRASSVRWPAAGARKAAPWAPERVAAMAAELPGRYQIIPWLGAGTGMRQGELFGLAVDDVRFLGRDPRIAVGRQVKLVDGRLCFAPLKNRKPHSVPLARSLAPLLARHLELYPAVEVTLPWHDLRDPGRHGKPVTFRLMLSDGRGALDRARFAGVWVPARKRAGIVAETGARSNGMHALRHTAASAWLRAGIDVVRVAAWLGDTPAVVLGAYAHLMPGDSGDDGRAAVDAFFGPCAPDVPSEGATGEL